jgi:hypothetical protein
MAFKEKTRYFPKEPLQQNSFFKNYTENLSQNHIVQRLRVSLENKTLTP